MKSLFISLSVLALLTANAFAGEVQYLCQNVDYQIIDGSLNGQPYFMKLTFTEDSYDQDAKIELFDNYQNPNTDDGLTRNCHNHPISSFKSRAIVCMDADDFSFDDARAYMSFKIDSFNGGLRPTFLANFYDTNASGGRYNFRINKETQRQFYCKKVEN
jgi:hypothetical protein